MDSFEQLMFSCDHSDTYPQNIIHDSAPADSLATYYKRLENEARRIFSTEGRAQLDFLDLIDAKDEFRSNSANTLNELIKRLREAFPPYGEAFPSQDTDPFCRFMFIHARHARDYLRVSRQMLAFVFSYYQVMPAFLDFVFSFGKQEHLQDFFFSGFKLDDHLDPLQRYPAIPRLGRSGREVRFCYNLRSVESSQDQGELPWSIRQTAIYHSFDFETGQSFWTIVKGNKLMKKRLTEFLTRSRASHPRCYDSKYDAFKSSLEVHLVVCNWSVENWRWYIKDLEDKLQALTRRTLSTPVDGVPSTVASTVVSPVSPRSPDVGIFSPSRANTIPLEMSPRTGTATIKPISRRETGLSQAQTAVVEEGWTEALPKLRFLKLTAKKQEYNPTSDMVGEGPQHLEESKKDKLVPPIPPTGIPGLNDVNSPTDFSFSHLQRIQRFEEKAQEASLVLKLNADVIEELRLQHEAFLDRSDFADLMGSSCNEDIRKFSKRLTSLEKDLKMQQSRAEALLQLLGNRKNLLYGILQYRSTQANHFFAQKAQMTADYMAQMTTAQQDIAEKTKQETVSMRVITLVTLFFLPGTFIATFMSTDIIKFDMDRSIFQPQGLRIYLSICIPMMVVTFLAWFIVYQCLKGKGRWKRKKSTGNALSDDVV